MSGKYGSREAMISAMNAAVQQKYLSYVEQHKAIQIKMDGVSLVGGVIHYRKLNRLLNVQLEGKLSYATIRGTSK